MTYLPSLFKKIDIFYRQAMSFTKKAEPDYAEQLITIAGLVKDPGLSSQLNILAQLYRAALAMGGGYSTIAKIIDNLKTMYSDGGVSDIEHILNGMLGVLTKEAGGPQALMGKDNPRFVERLAHLRDEMTSESKEDDDIYESYQDETSNEGAEGDNPEDLGDYGIDDGSEGEGGGDDPVNPAALGLGNKDDPKVNRGWHTTGPNKLHRNWKEYFANEVAAYNIQLSQAQDSDTARSLQELVTLIPQLSELVTTGTELSDQLKIAPDAEGSKKLEAIRAQITVLREKIGGLKRSVRAHRLQNEANSLAEQLVEANKKNDFKLKELLEQKLALNRLSQSNDVYKTKERNIRLRLIESMSGGNFPGKETLDKEKAKIQLASQERVSKEAYDRKITEERGKQQARLVTPEYEAARGGGRVPMQRLSPEKQIDLEKASFSALVYQFQIDIASAAQAARQAIYEMKQANKGSKGVKKQINTEYKAIIDEISEAIRKKDRAALQVAQAKLVAAVQNDVSVDKSQLKGYADVIKLEPHFRKVLEAIKDVTKGEKGAKQKKLDEAGNLIPTNFSDQDKETWQYILNDINRLRVLYTKHYMDMAGMAARRKDKTIVDEKWWQIKRLISPRFKRVIEDMGRIEINLALNLGLHRPEQKKRYHERSPVLQEIGRQQNEEFQKKQEGGLKNSSVNSRFILLKMAQGLGTENEVDKDTADRLANEIFDKIYDQAYDNMFNELAV